MSISYHINPDIGKPNICRAKIPEKCLYRKGDNIPPHYETKQEALVAYEDSQKDKKFTSLQKNMKEPIISDNNNEKLPIELQNLIRTKGQSYALNLHKYMKEFSLPLKSMNQEESDALLKEMSQEYNLLTQNDDDKIRAINAYTGLSYEYINEYYRGHYDSESEDLGELIDSFGLSYYDLQLEDPEEYDDVYEENIENLREHISDIDYMLKEMEKEHDNSEYAHDVKHLYRYVNLGKYSRENLLKSSQIGEIYHEDAYLSTTQDPNFIAGHLHLKNRDESPENYVVYHILSKKGISAQQSGAYESGYQEQDFEKERILPRGMNLRIVGVKDKEFKVDPTREKLKRYYDGYYGPKESYDVPPSTVKVIEVIDEDLLTSNNENNVS